MTAAATIPLNGFQRTMLLWEEIHPYIAVHAVRLRGHCDGDALRDAIAAARRELGVGSICVAPDGRSMAIAPPAETAALSVSECDGADAALTAAIDEEMNRPFGAGRHDPLRWRVLQRRDDSFWLLLAYHHVVADARGIERLMARIVARCVGAAPVEASRAAVSRPPPVERTASAPAAFVRAMGLYFRMRYAHKMPDEREMDDRTVTARRSLAAPETARLIAACKSGGVGVNDACLAALTAALAEQTPDRRVSRHRRELVLASVLSTRAAERCGAGAASQSAWDVRLADMLVRVRHPDAGMSSILRTIAAQTQQAKRRRSATPVSVMHGFFVRNIWPIFGIPNHRRSYRKLLPISGGVSSVRVAEAGFGAAADSVLAYVRACPPGPAMPLVLAPTLMRGRVELTLVFRPATMPMLRGEALLDSVVAALSRP
ncbi:peptide synthase [Phycisphaerae bacterium RAS1]|nr:peptide synthase [Phycisphaerae bacterium RAS1]